MGLHKTSEKKVALLFILALFLFLRCFFVFGITCGDNAIYTSNAIAIKEGKFVGSDSVFSSRLGIILPLAASFKLFGNYAFANVLPFIAFSLLQAAIVYLIAKMLFGDICAIFSLLVISIFQLDIFNATDIHGDMVMTTFQSLAVLLLLAASFKQIGNTCLLCFFSGLFGGCAVFAKESGVAIIIVLIALTLFLRIRNIKYVILGFFSGLLTFFISSYVVLGNPFVIFSGIFHHLTSDIYGYYKGGHYLWMLEYLIMFTDPLTDYSSRFVFPVSLIGISAMIFFIKDRGVKVMSIWFCVLFLIYNFMPRI